MLNWGQRGLFWALALAVALLTADIVFRPCLFVCGGGRVFMAVPLMCPQEVTINFVHSVQRTPVWEYLRVYGDGRGFELVATRYQSFGVGLPFLPDEGEFRREGDYFIMDNMQRRYHRLSLRTGVGTRLTVAVGGEVCRLHELLLPGSRVDLVVMPYWRLWLAGL